MDEDGLARSTVTRLAAVCLLQQLVNGQPGWDRTRQRTVASVLVGFVGRCSLAGVGLTRRGPFHVGWSRVCIVLASAHPVQ